MTKPSNQKSAILILDFGSQYSQLLARRVRELGIYCELWNWDVSSSKIREFSPQGIILSGSHESVIRSGSPRAPECVFTLGVPVLGICYGMQIMALQLGGKIENAVKREFGSAKVEITYSSPFLENLGDKNYDNDNPVLDVWMSHGDNVTELPPHFTAIAQTENCPFAIIAEEKKHFYGIQFHPEVTQTIQGTLILSRFVTNICGCDPQWTPTNIIEERVTSLRQTLGNDRVILALSGGVDSSVAALLLHRAIGDRLTCVFVDNGLLRLNEAKEVMERFHQHFHLNVISINAQDRFFKALKGVADPEEKRKTIGRVFIDVFDEVAGGLPDIKWLAQGTIYSDVIESAATKTGGAKVIKSHHNVGGLPEKLSLKLVEPLNDLFKDEVRKIGLALGLPEVLLWRHPFPGPGLGVRILGEINNTFCDLLRCADAIFIEELQKHNLYSKVSQAFAVFLPIRSVGVMGDERQYDWIIALRAVETVDFMTAHWAQLPYDFLAMVSNRIINEVKGISRVVYDISGKPPATIEWE